MRRSLRRNPDLIGDLLVAGVVVGVAIFGVRALNGGLKGINAGFQLPDVGSIIGDQFNQTAHEAGLAGDRAIYSVTGMPSQSLVDSVSMADLEKNWESWQGPFGPLSFWGKPGTINGLIDQWFDKSRDLFGLQAYDPRPWGAFTSWVKVTYDFTMPSHSLPYFDQRAAPLGGTT